MSRKLVLGFAFLDEERPEHKRSRQQCGEEPVHDLLESFHVHPPSKVLFVRASPDGWWGEPGVSVFALAETVAGHRQAQLSFLPLTDIEGFTTVPTLVE